MTKWKFTCVIMIGDIQMAQISTFHVLHIDILTLHRQELQNDRDELQKQIDKLKREHGNFMSEVTSRITRGREKYLQQTQKVIKLFEKYLVSHTSNVQILNFNPVFLYQKYSILIN